MVMLKLAGVGDHPASARLPRRTSCRLRYSRNLAQNSMRDLRLHPRFDHHEGNLSPRLSFFATMAALMVLTCGVSRAGAFQPVQKPLESSFVLPMVGNFFAGVTGVPPPSLLDKTWTNGVVEQTSLEDVDLECAYKASRDGWSAIDFHRAIDERGSGLVVALSRSGAVFGGFNPLGWRSTDEYSGSNSAFLWFVKGSQVTKCPILPGGKQLASYHIFSLCC